MAQKIVILGNSSSFGSAILLDAVLDQLKRESDHFQLNGIYDTATAPPPTAPAKFYRKMVIPMARWLFDHRQKPVFMRPVVRNIYAIARKHSVLIKTPLERNINHPDFVRRLADGCSSAVVLSLGCLQIFRKPVLDAVQNVVNYHNGRLPEYKGLHASSWELFHAERFFGYTFHYMDEKIDEGNILIRNGINVGDPVLPLEIEYLKAYAAARDVPSLFAKLRRQDRGTPQPADNGAYYGQDDFNRIRTIDSPQNYSYEDLRCRLKCFGMLFIRLNDQPHAVTRIDRVSRSGGGTDPRYFFTRDNVLVKATRFSYLPYGWHQIRKRKKGPIRNYHQ